MRPTRRRSGCPDRDHGFTLLELMVTLTVAGILIGVSVWSMQHFIVGNRVGAAAREFMARARSASAIAARTNTPVELRFIPTGAGCVPRYELRTATASYDTVCIATEYPGVEVAEAVGELKCGAETGIQSCSLCAAASTITFFPSGEVTTPNADTDGASVVFRVRGEDTEARTVGVGIRNVSGLARAYRPNAAATAWECP